MLLFILGVSFIFLLLAHSTLLHFKMKESNNIPLAQCIFPWPKNGGKFVSILCLMLSGIFFFLFLIFLNKTSIYVTGFWKIFIALIFVPGFFYLLYITSGISRSDNRLHFSTPINSGRKWIFPVIISLTISFIFWIFGG